MPMGLMGTMIAQLREAVRGSVERLVVVLPHLDLLTTSAGGLTAEAREVIPLLYENPELIWLGFKDPSFPLPRVIENLFPHRISLLGIGRSKLRQLITQRESRKFGREFNPWQLYKHVSGVNAVRLRRLLSTLEGEDYPADPRRAYRQLRQATLVGALEVPSIDLDRDVGGYARVKQRLRAEILDVMAAKDRSADADEVSRLEELIPRGMIFWGPPGTGKTLFAKGMAASLGAAITVVSGPELKSKWVGESEDNLRQVFHRARQSAPSIIVFDELDSFASARGTYTGSGVEHSMVNQLLTEMDGFRKEELVFVIGTTNFVEILDPALLRPGRFEFHLHIPYPEADDRREILQIYDRKMRLQFSEEALDYAVRRTGRGYMTPTGTPFSGDHLNALCRAVARIRLRDARSDATTPGDVERALTEWVDRPKMTSAEERVLATHEAGHAVCSLFCTHTPPIERITIESENPWAFGYVRHSDPTHKYIQTRGFYLDARHGRRDGRPGPLPRRPRRQPAPPRPVGGAEGGAGQERPRHPGGGEAASGPDSARQPPAPGDAARFTPGEEDAGRPDAEGVSRPRGVEERRQRGEEGQGQGRRAQEQGGECVTGTVQDNGETEKRYSHPTQEETQYTSPSSIGGMARVFSHQWYEDRWGSKDPPQHSGPYQ
jgi:cell division protease FtsH